MRRALPVAAATVGGLAWLAHFHTTASLGLGATATPSSTPATSGAPPAASSVGPNPPGVTAAPRTGPPATGAPGTATRPPSTARAAPSRTTAPSGGTRTIDGPDVTTSYGDVQVRITVAGPRIIDVQALRLPNDRSRSARISQVAGPELRQEALQAQSARIDGVSGASYTSEGYIESLQGALDKVGK